MPFFPCINTSNWWHNHVNICLLPRIELPQLHLPHRRQPHTRKHADGVSSESNPGFFSFLCHSSQRFPPAPVKAENVVMTQTGWGTKASSTLAGHDFIFHSARKAMTRSEALRDWCFYKDFAVSTVPHHRPHSGDAGGKKTTTGPDRLSANPACGLALIEAAA